MDPTGITKAGDYLFTQGVLGVFLVLAIGVILVLAGVIKKKDQAVTECQENRVKAAEDMVVECTRCITNNSQHLAMSTTALSSASGVNEARLIALATLTQAVDNLREEVKRK